MEYAGIEWLILNSGHRWK